MRTAATLLAAALLAASPALAGDAALPDGCAACHALEKPTGDALGHVTGRNGPDLHYAGSKFKRDWLVDWLQKPETIRPGGAFFMNAAKPGAPRDVLDPAKLAKHPVLTRAEAEKAADALMAKTAPDLVPPGGAKGEKPNERMAQMSFGKLRGCSACHQATPGEGGVSGPELHSAGRRLQPDFIAAYIRDPQKIDPRVWMPSVAISEPDVQKLTGWLSQRGLAETNQGDAKP
ncbi:MAG TPA: hypothetical protein VEB20_01790 [Azospirillaceae bacterium]|nr:hypothetical protein [Azospirillaceae bacterium]